MAYFQILKDLGMNYTLNRPLLDGKATARIEIAQALAAKIVDFDTWHSAWLDLARQSEAEGRWLDAATYYHQAEFYLPAGEVRNGLYDDFARTFARGMEGQTNYERIKVPYQTGYLPGFRLRAVGEELATFVFNGGYDSFVEEFYPFLKPLSQAATPSSALMDQDRAERSGRDCASPMHGNGRRRRCWTISSSARWIGSARPVAATWRCAPPRLNPGSSTSCHFRPPIGAWTWRCGRCSRARTVH